MADTLPDPLVPKRRPINDGYGQGDVKPPFPLSDYLPYFLSSVERVHG